MRHTLLLVLVLALGLALPACGNGEEAPPPESAQSIAEKITAMGTAIEALEARPEHGASEVTVQYLLVGIQGPDLPGVTRAAGDAERLTAELFARAMGGQDFDTLVKNSSDDPPPGIWTLATSGSSDHARSIALRSDVLPGLGDVAWRLAVGEIGVVDYDPQPPTGTAKNPTGFRIVKRLR